MSDVLDGIKREIAQLTEAVNSRNGDTATIDRKALAAEVEGLVNAQVKAKLDESRRNEPVRKGEIVGPPGFETISKGIVEEGRFAGKQVDELMFTHWLLNEAAEMSPGKVRRPSKELSDIYAKALTATGSGTGDEYVPTNLASSLWNDFFITARVAQQFDNLAQPTDPWDFPLGWGDVTWRKGTQNTATTVSDPATAKTTFTATEQVAEINLSYDLDEDSIIAVLPSLREMLARTGGEQIDKFLMNADATNAGTGNINLDDADPADDSYYLSNGQDGLRHLFLVDNTAQSTDINTTLTDALLRAGISRLGKYAADPTNTRMFVDPETYVNGILALTNVVTVDKFGPQATVVTGGLAAYGGIPIVVTSSIAEAEDDGKLSTTGSNNDEGQICLAHRDMWKVAFKRNLLLELDKSIQKRQLILVASFRMSVAARGTRSAATHTAGVHGIVRA